MKYFSEHKIFSLLILFGLLAWLAPSALAYLDDPADASQNKCSKEDKPDDPLKIERPNFVGRVLSIRLTDDGSFVDRCELSNVLYDLNWDAERHPGEFRPRRRPDAVSLPKLVVLYIHGWKHSADPRDSDFVNFSQMIHGLAANTPEKQVLGVYVGWNASSKIFPLNVSPLNNLTFWSKATVADRIAQSAVTTKIISSISSILSKGDAAANQFITIGHSFGARVLFSATSQSLIYDTEKAHPGYPSGTYGLIKGIANAVILLNPAFEASRYTALDSVTRIEESFAPNQLPLLIAISSDGDRATKWAFPAGQWLGFYRSEGELTTLGNCTNFRTHTLLEKNENECKALSSDDALSEAFPANGLCLARQIQTFRMNVPTPPRRLCFSEDEQNPDRIFQRRNPFLIARTTSSIIRDHNDIWNDKFSGWLSGYIAALGKQVRPRLATN